MAILIHKLKKLNPKRALIAVGLAGFTAFLLSFPFAGATGPAFNIFPISYSNALNHDLPLLDARNISRGEGWSISQTDHDAGIQASAGEIIEFSIYYHNGAADTPENIANNVLIRAFANPTLSNPAQTHAISASVGAGNAATISSGSRGGDIQVQIQGGQPLALSLVSGSTVLYRDRGLNPLPSPQTLPDTIFSSGANIGNVNGCWQYAGFVNFRAQVSPLLAGALELQKDVKNVTDNTAYNSAEVAADPGDTVEYRITFRAINNPVLDVFIKDALDPKLSLTGQVTLDGQPLASSQFFSNAGVSIQDLQAGVNHIVVFRVIVAPASQFGIGTHILGNTATVFRSFSPARSAQDSADVRVVIAPQQVSCNFTWGAPVVSGTQRGLRHTGEQFNVQQNVSNLQPASSFNIVHRHISGAPSFSYASTANSSGSFSQFNSSIIPQTYAASDYDVFIQVGSAFVATCNGLRIEQPLVQQLSLEKSVKLASASSFDNNQIDANPGERVTFKLVISPQSSNTTLSNINIRDTLPGKLSFVSGSFTVDGATQGESGFFGSGLNIGSLAPNSQRVIVFEADVASASNFTVGQCEVLPNSATALSGDLTDSDGANIRVCRQTPTKPSGSPGARPLGL